MKKALLLPVFLVVVSLTMCSNQLMAQGSTTHGNTDIQGTLKVSGLNDTAKTERLLIIDKLGNVRKGERYLPGPGGGMGSGGLGGSCPTTNPMWKNNNGTLYLCPESANVAIGADAASHKLLIDGILAVTNRIKIGNSSLYLGNDFLGNANNLFTDDADLFIQSSAGNNFNTILNFNNTGNVGIGTDDPEKQLHVKTFHTVDISDPSPPDGPHHSHYGIRLEEATTVIDGVNPNATFNTIWDIEPRENQLVLGKPGVPVLTLNDAENVYVHNTLRVVKFVAVGDVGTPLLLMGETSSEKRIWTGSGDLNLQGYSDNINGRVVIGSNDKTQLHVNGKISLQGAHSDYESGKNTPVIYAAASTFEGESDNFGSMVLQARSDADRPIIFVTGSTPEERMRISSDGKIGIGTTDMPGNYMLYVKDGILSEKVKAAVEGSADWADDVFYDNYKLMSIPELEKYINAEKHLPGVLSADEAVKNGVDMVEMDATLLRKVEELTLYTISQDKQIKAKEKQLKEQDKKINELEQKIEKLEQQFEAMQKN